MNLIGERVWGLLADEREPRRWCTSSGCFDLPWRISFLTCRIVEILVAAEL